MKKLRKTEAVLKKSIALKKKTCIEIRKVSGVSVKNLLFFHIERIFLV